MNIKEAYFSKMFDLKQPENLKRTQLCQINGNPNEIIGADPNNLKWSSITSIGGNAKYSGTTQSITAAYTKPTATTEELSSTDLKYENTIEYWVHKELFRVIIESAIPYELTGRFDLSDMNIDRGDLATCMSGLFWNCFSASNADENVIEFIRKDFIKYRGRELSGVCGWEIFSWKKHHQYEWAMDPDYRVPNQIRTFLVSSLPNAFEKFKNKLGNYGVWEIDKVLPSENEYAIVNYKDLEPSPRFKELRKSSQVYKDYVKEHGNDSGFEFRQESALDILHGLGATLKTNSSLTLSLSDGSYNRTFEGSTTNNENNIWKVSSAFLSHSLPIITKAICSSKNEFGHIFNLVESWKNDMKIKVVYTQNKVLNGNLFANANIPDGLKSSDVRLKENFSIFGSPSQVSTVTVTAHSFTNRTKFTFKKDQNFVNKLKELDRKNFNSRTDLINTIKDLDKTFNNPITNRVIQELELSINNSWDKKYSFLGTWCQYYGSRCFVFRFMLLEYCAAFFDSLKNNEIKIAGFDYPNGKFYESSDHPLLTRLWKLPEVKWISQSAVDMATQVIKSQLIPSILNTWRTEIDSKIKKIYMTQKYIKECQQKMPSETFLNEYPILPMIGVFNNRSFSTLDGVHRLSVYENGNWLSSETTKIKNSITWFNENLLENWNVWNDSVSIQIKLPETLKSLEVFYTNQSLIGLSFPYTYDELSPDAIQITDNSKLSIGQDGNFESIGSVKVKCVDTEQGEITNKTIQIFIPVKYSGRIKVVKLTNDNSFILIPFYLEGSASIPQVLTNALF